MTPLRILQVFVTVCVTVLTVCVTALRLIGRSAPLPPPAAVPVGVVHLVCLDGAGYLVSAEIKNQEHYGLIMC